LPWIGQEAPDGCTFRPGDGSAPTTTCLCWARSAAAAVAAQAGDARGGAEQAGAPRHRYLHNFDAPEQPLALRCRPARGVPAQLLAHAVKRCKRKFAQRLDCEGYKRRERSSERIEQALERRCCGHYAKLTAFAEARSFSLHRDAGRMVFTLTGKKDRRSPRTRCCAAESAPDEGTGRAGTARRDHPLYRANPSRWSAR